MPPIGDDMSVLEGAQPIMSKKRNVVLYLDKGLVEKSRELGFNLSKTFENHLKNLIAQFSNTNTLSMNQSGQQSSPGEIRTLVGGSKARYAWPLHHRASPHYLPNTSNLLSAPSLSFPRSNKRSHRLRNLQRWFLTSQSCHPSMICNTVWC